MSIKKYENENGISLIESIKDNVKSSIEAISRDNRGQGAAEYILLFGGVIVIALAGLLIYRSYFSNTASGLNATQDISSIRNNVSIY
ncbi:MAG: class III signal peptide-containing protein [Methanobrevibacter sp.]|nr:class III signal peptide-containing protein [Methanobrevibacter sp.]